MKTPKTETQPNSTAAQPMPPKFSLGNVVGTPAAIAACKTQAILNLLVSRHVTGDYGEVCDEDKAANDEACASEVEGTENATRVVSSYDLSKYGLGETRVFIITEWDRSVTTLLLPEEY